MEERRKKYKPYTYLTQEGVMNLINDYKNNGNIEARNKLFNVYKPMADRIINSVFKNKDMCKDISKDDLTQEVYLAIFEYIETYKGSTKTTFSVMVYHSILSVVKKFLNNVEKLSNVGYLSQFDISYSSEVVSSEMIEDYCDYNNLRDILNDLLETLTPREEKVLKMRFGFYNGRIMILDEIGRYFDIPRERVRQIEAKGLKKLRHPSRKKRLEGFL